jgi:hypothetical protein
LWLLLLRRRSRGTVVVGRCGTGRLVGPVRLLGIAVVLGMGVLPARGRVGMVRASIALVFVLDLADLGRRMAILSRQNDGLGIRVSIRAGFVVSRRSRLEILTRRRRSAVGR